MIFYCTSWRRNVYLKKIVIINTVASFYDLSVFFNTLFTRLGWADGRIVVEFSESFKMADNYGVADDYMNHFVKKGI